MHTYFGNGMDYTKIKEKDIRKAIEVFNEYQKKLYDNGYKIQTNTIQAGPIHMEIVVEIKKKKGIWEGRKKRKELSTRGSRRFCRSG